MNKIILDGKIIKREDLPCGSVISGKLFFNNEDREYGRIERDPMILYHSGKKLNGAGLSGGTDLELLYDLQVYHIPGYQKMWLATDVEGTYIFTIKPSLTRYFPDGDGVWETIEVYSADTYQHIYKRSIDNYGQTRDDEPWEYWVKIKD